MRNHQSDLSLLYPASIQTDSERAGAGIFTRYLKLERELEGYYVVFDHRKAPEPRAETETLEGLTIRSYVIPVVQASPSVDR